MFKNYISHIVPRKNSITGISYSNDLAILSWELMNEPRNLARNSEFVRDWTREMSEYIKEKDKMHLVYIGSELEVGTNFAGTALGLCAIDSIDICSSHIYLYDEQKSLYRNLEQVASFVDEQGKFAREQKKPLLVGEFGISEKHQPFKESSLKVMEDVIRIILKNNSAGFLIWDWDPLYYYDAFSFGMDGHKKYNIKKLEALINIK
jgi:mannan endo-1,4-beta-mannosidase